jgi:hypothetical protein
VSKRPVPTVSNPRVGILDLGGEDTKDLVRSDAAFLRALFADVKPMGLSAVKCDVLFLYASLTPEGALVGSSAGLRELIRESGARVVVVASPNPSRSYINAGKQQAYGRANLVMTLNRRGESFGRFFSGLFSKMKSGISMPVAWIELSPQAPAKGQPAPPETIFACEIGPLTFS